jgi:gamma-glutamyltranspeptidase/glutathione hydrolase
MNNASAPASGPVLQINPDEWNVLRRLCLDERWSRFAAALTLLAAVFAAGAGTPIAGPAKFAAADDAAGPGDQTASSLTRAEHGMVVSADGRASRIGLEILQAGGNAVDAAVATGLALAVVHPAAGNIGGGGFMVIRRPDGRATTIDFREKAPLAAHAKMFLTREGTYSFEVHHNSHLAVGVPGTVAGFALAHRKYGTGQWARLVEPAIRLADEGFAVSEHLARSLRSVLPAMERYPASVAAFSNKGVPYEAGETLRQPDLANTLRRIMREGPDGFYKGETARLLVAEMRRGGGIITEEDLARYAPKERSPIRGTYRGYEIISMPPPSSGGIALVEMLNILEGYDLAGMGHSSPAYVHHLVEAMRRAYRDRARFVADPEFADVPITKLTSKEYAAALRNSIDPKRATPSRIEDLRPGHESRETTHYSVVDAGGLAVAVTYTLEMSYGSKIVVPGAGFLLNNEMGDFNAAPGLTTEAGLIGTEANLARPEQRMLSSMTPTIVARDGGLVAVIGSPGGRTIINTVLQVVLNLIDFEMDIAEAVKAPRLHHQWLPDYVRIEETGADPALLKELRTMGHTVQVGGPQGRAHCIQMDVRLGARLGAADPRDGDACAAGY